MEMEAAHASPVAALPSQTMTASAHDKAGGTTAVTINMPPPTNTVTPTAAHAKQPITLSWQDLHYAVPVGGKPKKGGEQEMRPLLQGVDGVVRPGKVVAIMGASGAGKRCVMWVRMTCMRSFVNINANGDLFRRH